MTDIQTLVKVCKRGHDLTLPGATMTLTGITLCLKCRSMAKNAAPVDPIDDLVQQDSLSLAALYRKGKKAGVITHRTEYGG